MNQIYCYIELFSFNDFSRYACAFREYLLRIYSQVLNETRILSCSWILANTLVMFYTPMKKFGRYISYLASDGKEYCDIVESTKDISKYAPIIHMENKISPLPTKSAKFSDQFHPIKVNDLGSLSRLTHDPEFPEEPNLTLFATPFQNYWALGYVTSLKMDVVYYQFNYIQLDFEPSKPFVKYQGHEGKDPEFSDNLEHGFTYLPIIKIKSEHEIFGLKTQ